MRFDEVICHYGYPLISKEISKAIYGARRGQWSSVAKMEGTYTTKTGNASRYSFTKYKPLLNAPFNISDYCCAVMKKRPALQYSKTSRQHPITGEMACESDRRRTQWIKDGCNGFDMKKPKSTPIAFWLEQDVLWYVKEMGLPIASVYGDIIYKENPNQIRMEELLGESVVPGSETLCTTGCQRTGCYPCPFGAHLEKGETRFERLKRTHPRQYEYCMGGGEWNGVLWQPNRRGLGMAYVFDYLNGIYGKSFLRY